MSDAGVPASLHVRAGTCPDPPVRGTALTHFPPLTFTHQNPEAQEGAVWAQEYTAVMDEKTEAAISLAASAGYFAAAEAWFRSKPVPPMKERDRLANYEQLVARTVEVFGDEVKASRWLSLPSPDLNGETPLQVAQRDNYSLLLLEPILVRIEHGIDF